MDAAQAKLDKLLGQRYDACTEHVYGEDVGLTYIMRRSIVEAGTAVEDMYIYMIIAEYFTKAL